MSRATQDSATLQMASCTGLSPSAEELSRTFHSPSVLRCRSPTTPLMPCDISGLGSSPVARHYWGNHILFSLPTGTKMFQFPAFAFRMSGMTGLQPAGFSHSDICGSRVVCTYPQLFAAYHVLHRLQEPRHPPYALSYLLSPPEGGVCWKPRISSKILRRLIVVYYLYAFSYLEVSLLLHCCNPRHLLVG